MGSRYEERETMALSGSSLSTVVSVAQSHMYCESANAIAVIRTVNVVKKFELVAVHETRMQDRQSEVMRNRSR